MLSLNPAKIEFLLIGTPQQRQRVLNLIITFEGSQISLSSTSRNLGVLFDPNLLFHDHISSICKSSFFLIRMLRNIRHCLIFTLLLYLQTHLSPQNLIIAIPYYMASLNP